MISANVYIGTSLDGFIARADGDIDWLMKFADSDAVDAYNEFMAMPTTTGVKVSRSVT